MPSRLRAARSPRRFAAVTATAITVPVTLVVLLALSRTPQHADPGPGDPTVTASAMGTCRILIRTLPATLDGLDRNRPASRPPFVLAWGKPPIVLQCGVARPPQLKPYSTAQLIGSGRDLSVNWLPVPRSTATEWTIIDRSVYIRLTVPDSYATPPIDALSTIVARILPPVCSVTMTAGKSQPQGGVLCTHRR